MPADHPPAVRQEAEEVARRGPVLPPGVTTPWVDATDLDLVTIDPPGSRDLDQALHLARRGDGFRVSYAIADVAAFVTPGGAIDREAWARGTTLYLPDGSARLHPATLSEGAASLLADGGDRPAVLWQLDLDGAGELQRTEVRRALVRSRRQLGYAEAQQLIDAHRGAGGLPGGLELLGEIGRARQALEVARGGISLQLPEQDVVVEDGRYRLTFRRTLPVEGWNAQLSLLTGMAAAALMAQGGLGIVRVLPPAEPAALEGLRRCAAALAVSWPPEEPYAAFVRRLRAEDPAEAAVLHQAAKTLRGAGYQSIGVPDPTRAPAATTPVATTPAATAAVSASGPAAPTPARHEALAALYAHVTAPLRRLVDRYGSEVAIALCAGAVIPPWVRQGLAELPAAMAAAGQRSSRVDSAVLDLLEALVLRDLVGAPFTAIVVDTNERHSRVQLRNPAVVASVAAALPLGESVTLTLTEADPAARRVVFAPAQAGEG